MVTAVDMGSVLRAEGMYVIEDGFRVAVVVKDTRSVWGRVDYLVVPLSGCGEKWVSSDKVDLRGRM